VKKVLNILMVLTGLSALTGLLLLWLKPFLGLQYFDLTLFMIIVVFSLFIFKVYLTYSNIISFFKWSIAFLLLVPLIVAFVGLFTSSVYENSWPLLVSMVIFQCLIGFLSLIKVFDKNSMLTNFQKVFAIYAAIFTVSLMIIILLKLSLEEVYLSSFIGALIMLVLFFAALFSQKAKA
jgi:hypothetical protein